MVSSTHWLAAASGMRMLERGGNAFDAAAAAGFVLQIVEPHQNGPGGDLPVVFWSADVGAPRVLCAQGPAPAAATMERYAGLDLVPGEGLLAAVVPGAFDGWMQLVRDFGTLRLAEILEPAIGYAADGFPVVRELAAEVAAHAERFRAEWPSSAEVWLRDGGPRDVTRCRVSPRPTAGSSRRRRAATARPSSTRRAMPSTEGSSRTRSTASARWCAATTWRAGAPRTRTRSCSTTAG